ncbi:MAG: DUF2442 domain-containing protein [Cyanobacteria bacterium LVE1205-1]|jgi:hypothetical protein
MFLHIVSTSYIDNYKIKIQFNDHRTGIVDLVDSLKGKVFRPFQDLDLFQQFEVDVGLGAICWSNGADLRLNIYIFLHFVSFLNFRNSLKNRGICQPKLLLAEL